MFELEEPFAKAAGEKNMQAAASEINIRSKELALTKLLLQKVSYQEIGSNSRILCSANKNLEI